MLVDQHFAPSVAVLRLSHLISKEPGQQHKQNFHPELASYVTGTNRVSTLFAISRIASNEVSFNVQTSL